jgi:hypothetical protein
LNAWNRLGLVIDDPQDGVGVNLFMYLNGDLVSSTVQAITGEPVPGLAIVWSTNNPPPTLLSSSSGNTGEIYSSGIRFEAVAMTPEMIAGLGAPDNGPLPLLVTSIGAAPVLSATVSNGIVNLSWTGSPYLLQETTDLASGIWQNATLPFDESEANGGISTTAHADPALEGPSRFYRLIFSP